MNPPERRTPIRRDPKSPTRRIRVRRSGSRETPSFCPPRIRTTNRKVKAARSVVECGGRGTSTPLWLRGEKRCLDDSPPHSKTLRASFGARWMERFLQRNSGLLPLCHGRRAPAFAHEESGRKSLYLFRSFGFGTEWKGDGTQLRRQPATDARPARIQLGTNSKPKQTE